ncbi:MAG: serine/threonine protein kinase [Saprospiraceae bacterium]
MESNYGDSQDPKNYGANMKAETIRSIFNEFDHKSTYVSHRELNSGHINDTFLVESDGNKDYILQRINHNVFKDVPGLMNNKVLTSNHIRSKYPNFSEEELSKKVLSFVKTKSKDFYYFKNGENFWNLMVFIEDSITHEIAKNEEIAFEGGKLLGEFLNLTSDFESRQLIEVIPYFHDMSFRFKQYGLSVQSAPKERLQKAIKYTKIVSELKEEMHILQNLKDARKIPLRVTHNDAKISNSLFDKDNKGVCMIDTDTVMPGIIHYDFGDAIRTICNTAAEDEKDLSKVEFNLDYYQAYKKGFLEKTEDTLTSMELEYLPLAAKTMIFIMALRFLTDYFNQDIYYKVKYQNHNLDRARNQFKLIESFSEKLSK